LTRAPFFSKLPLMKKAYLGVFLAGTMLLGNSGQVRADGWTYMYLMQNGFMQTDTARTVLDLGAQMALGTVGDPATILGKDQNILTTDMRQLNINGDELATLGAIYDNLGVRQSAASQHANTALLDQALKLGDLNDGTLKAAMEQAERLGLDPNGLQAMAQTVYSTAKLQVFDETLRTYERMGGASLGLQERQALKAQVDTLNADQISWELVNNMARERLKASEAQKKQLAQRLGRQVVQSAARQGVVLEGEWEEYAPPWEAAPSPGLYDYAELGGMVSLHSPPGSEHAAPTGLDTRTQESRPFVNPNNPLVSTGSINPNAPTGPYTANPLSGPSGLAGEGENRQWRGYVPTDVESIRNQLPPQAKHLAESFVASGQRYGVDPLFLMSISRMETGNWKSNAFLNRGNAMGISNASGVINQSSANASIDLAARSLAGGAGTNNYYANAFTVGQVGAIYAPVGASNDPRGTNGGWAAGVGSIYDGYVRTIR